MVELEISAITDEFSPEFDEVCEYLQEQDVKYIELRNVWIGNIVEVDDQTIGDALDIISDCGLKVSALAGPLLKCLPPTETPQPAKAMDYTNNFEYNYSKLDRLIELAEKFDAPYIRCFGYQGKWDIKPVSEWDSWEIYKDWGRAVTQFQSRLKEHGKMLICENDSGLLKSLEQVERIGKDHAGETLGMLFDTQNVIRATGMAGILTDDWLPRLAPYIQYIHAKGCLPESQGFKTEVVGVENDIVGWPRIIDFFRNFQSNQFTSPAPNPLFLSIETHMGKENQWENSTKSLKNLQNLLS